MKNLSQGRKSSVRIGKPSVRVGKTLIHYIRHERFTITFNDLEARVGLCRLQIKYF
jgi:hypothetical protein